MFPIKRAKSMRLQLLRTISVSLLIVWGAIVWFAYDKGWHEAQELMDGQLALSARLLEGQINHEENYHPSSWYYGSVPVLEFSPNEITNIFKQEERLPYEQELAFQIRDINAVLKLTSANAVDMKFTPAIGYHQQQFNHVLWRTYTKRSRDSQYFIQVAHPVNTRNLIGLDVAWRVTIPLVLAFPLLILMLYWAVSRSLKPLKLIAENLTQRQADMLDPVPEQGVVKELLPIIRSFNSLLERVACTVENERRFTSNAAHELRTPLAGIKIYAQLSETAQDDFSRQQYISQVLIGVGRAERLVEQMLWLARLDPENNIYQKNVEKIDIRHLLMQVQNTEMIHLRVKSQQTVLSCAPDLLNMNGIEDLLLVAMSNLVGNASRYAPNHTLISIGSFCDAQHFGLFVEDQGDGIALADLPFVKDRFKRGSEVTVEGSGLGLAIVERIAEIHGAKLVLRNLPESGFRAEIVWDHENIKNKS